MNMVDLRISILLPALALLCALFCPSSLLAEEKVLYEKDSAYYHIKVYEQDGLRYLKCNRQVQSAMKISDPLHIEYVYVKGMMSALSFVDTVRDVLIIGLGGGTLPAYLRAYFPDTAIDIAEIDPEIVAVARSFFNFSEGPRTAITVEDGRSFLKRNQKRYDIIFLDAYVADTIPFHLTTQEFLSLVKRRLKTGGIVASHIWAPEINRFYYAQAKTYQAVFSEVYLFNAGKGAHIFIGSPSKGSVSKETLMEKAGRLARQRGLSIDIALIIKNAYSYDTTTSFSAQVLTDDFAPVGILQHQKAD